MNCFSADKAPVSCLAVEITEGSSSWHYPEGFVFILCDEIAFAGCTVHRVVLIGKEPLLLSGLRIDECYSHAVCKCPYHTEIIGINLLYLCQRLTRALYVDDIKLEGARVVDDYTQVGCYQELVTCIFSWLIRVTPSGIGIMVSRFCRSYFASLPSSVARNSSSPTPLSHLKGSLLGIFE